MLNSNVYTVEYLKQMKQYHEKNVMDSVLSTNVVDAPLQLCGIKFDSIIFEFEKLFDGNISAHKIGKYMIELLSFNTAVRSIIYFLVDYCWQGNMTSLNLGMIYPYVNVEYNMFEYIISVIEHEKYIEEICLSEDPLAGYEDVNGDLVLLNSNISYKIGKGLWQLRKRGKVLLAIEALLGKQAFYELVVGRNIEKLSGLN